jgi:hypothetical protein
MTTNTYDVGDVVMAAKALRNDGTYPDPAISIGEILVEVGTRGQVINVGLYLQEHIVYAVAFENGRIVGALERELEAPEDAPEAESAQPAAAQPVAAPTATAEGSAPAAVLLAEKVPAEPAAHGAGEHAAKTCKHGSANCKSAAADAELAVLSTPAEPAEAAEAATPAKPATPAKSATPAKAATGAKPTPPAKPAGKTVGAGTPGAKDGRR